MNGAPFQSDGSVEPPKRRVAPPLSDKRDRRKTDPMRSGGTHTSGAEDRAFRFMQVVWLCTITMIWIVVVVYFVLHPTKEAFNETVLGIIVVGITGSGFGFKFVYNVQ